MGGPNHPFVVWGSCFLWVTSMFAIAWSLMLFFCLGDILLITGTDMVIALVLLSGLIMMPTNVYMLYTIANGQRISHKARVLCCPLWMLIIWIIVINLVGAALCIQRLCLVNTKEFIMHNMKYYRNVPKSRHFIDSIQWSLKCCGIDSYKDWFNHDWYEKIRDFEWNPFNKKLRRDQNAITVSDSVPLSCCKSGTCVPNYLLELGTHSIYTKGCDKSVYSIYMILMNVHLSVFFLIIIVETIILSCIASSSHSDYGAKNRRGKFDVRHIMPINNKFEESCSSDSIHPNDSDAEEYPGEEIIRN